MSDLISRKALLKELNKWDISKLYLVDDFKGLVKEQPVRIGKVVPVIEPIYDAKGDHIDSMAKCGACSSFICYPTEYGAKSHYKYCTHCGTEIMWKGGVL